MEKVKADVADENGTVLLRDLAVSLVLVRHPNGFHRSWHGAFSLPHGFRQLDITGRYRLLLADGRTAEFLPTRIAPNFSDQTTEVEFDVSGDVV